MLTITPLLLVLGVVVVCAQDRWDTHISKDDDDKIIATILEWGSECVAILLGGCWCCWWWWKHDKHTQQPGLPRADACLVMWWHYLIHPSFIPSLVIALTRHPHVLSSSAVPPAVAASPEMKTVHVPVIRADHHCLDHYVYLDGTYAITAY